MRKKIVLIAAALLGIGIGYNFMPLLWELLHVSTNRILDNMAVNALIGLVVFIMPAYLFSNYMDDLLQRIEEKLLQQKPETLISESLGVVLGLIVAVLISTLFWHSQLFLLHTILPVILMIILVYLGFIIGRDRLIDFRRTFLFRRDKLDPENKIDTVAADNVLARRAGENFYRYKLLDTNILIDGRIYDLAKTGFLEGTLIVPNFVLYELQYIADSGDSIKRVRGRRGLDILNKLRSEQIVPIQMYDGDFEDITEVDSKLIKLAKLLDAEIVTNDYNLNKVSQFQNVKVLNVNALAKSLKPRVIPGEKLEVMVIKKGTERQQGVAYLDDGTMIVVEDGYYYMNKTIEVEVTSALQTDAGRMIFAKLAHSRRKLKAQSPAKDQEQESNLPQKRK
ncbi:PIN domain-containing protein [Ligilactobacillus saerimneri]